MNRQRNHQKRFLTQALGGPTNYTGESIRTAHGHLDLKEADFSAVAEDLLSTLQDLGVERNLINQTMEIVGSVKNGVLNL
jgi:hemoglobin